MASEKAAQDAEIAKIWETVRVKVVQLAGGNLANVQENLTIEEVLAYLARAQQSDRAAAEKFSMIKNVFNKTLKCISNLGGIVASAASQVFAPSSLCFNAVNFVIVAWQGYEGIFESLAGLLERCMDFLDRLTYYEQGGMDFKLTKVVCQHLQLFVAICDRAIQLRHSKLMKLKVFSKLFFLNDNDIAGLLGAMDGLVSKEGHLVAAQTFNFSSEAAMNSREGLTVAKNTDNKVDILVEDRIDQKKEKDAQKLHETVLKALAFDDDSLDKEKKEPKASWQTSQHNFRKSVVAETGNWIFEQEEFSAWLKGTSATPVLALEGIEGSGKSHLTSTVVMKLRSGDYTDSSDTRLLVAYYYLEGDTKDNSVTTDVFDHVAKSLVWQFSQSDAPYEKSVASICQKVKDLDPQDILNMLLLENKDRSKLSATFVIVIDGLSDTLDESFLKLLKNFAAQDGERPIRLLVTGKPSLFDSLRESAEVSFTSISISSYNVSDVKRYIDAKMNMIESLKNTARIGVPELREKIRETLCEKTNGDYFKLATNLDLISTIDTEPEIDRVLESAGAERSEQIKAEIAKLNKVRTPREIAEMNEIITWIIHARWWFSAEATDAILFVKSGERSLYSIETKIKTKYTLLEIDRDGDVNFKSGDTKDLIPFKDNASSGALDATDQAIVYPAEVDLVRHFLNTVCPPKTYEKFGFEKFFEEKLNHKTNYISLDNESNGHIKIAIGCLRVLTSKGDKRVAILSEYAQRWCVNHLSQVDLALAERELKRQVGPCIVALFTEDQHIDVIFWRTSPNVDEMNEFRPSWLYQDEAVNEALRWLRDSAVVSEVSDEAQKGWIKEVISDSNNSQHLLSNVARRTAWHCFRQPTRYDAVRQAILFLLAFFAKVAKRQDSSIDDIKEDIIPDVKQMESVETSAAKILDIQEKDTLWETQIATALYEFGHEAEAETRCRHALELDAHNWRASHLLAQLQTAVEDGIKILENLVETLGSDQAWMQDSENITEFSEILYDLGKKYQSQERYDLATSIFKRAIEVDPCSSESLGAVLTSYDDAERWNENINLLDTMHKVERNGESQLSSMARFNAFNEELHKAILRTTRKTDRVDLIDLYYTPAIEKSTVDKDHVTIHSLLLFYGIAQFSQPGGEEKAISTWEFSLNENLPKLDSFWQSNSLTALVSKLAPIYLQRARSAQLDSETANDYLQRLTVSLQHDADHTQYCPSKLYAARYYHVQGNNMKAKQTVRSIANVALEMLSDDDPDNDFEAYWRLVVVFLPLEDDENLLAAWAMATFAYQAQLSSPNSTGDSKDEEAAGMNDQEPNAGVAENSEENAPNDASKENALNDVETTVNDEGSHEAPGTAATPSARVGGTGEGNGDSVADNASEKSDAGEQNHQNYISAVAYCDGRCGRTWDRASQMYCCRDCIEVQFEPECYAKLMDGTLERHVCDKNHTFLYIPDWDEARMKDVPRGYVPLGDKNIALEDWKANIKKQYLDFEPEVDGINQD